MVKEKMKHDGALVKVIMGLLVTVVNRRKAL
jgi:hypothetical protein